MTGKFRACLLTWLFLYHDIVTNVKVHIITDDAPSLLSISYSITSSLVLIIQRDPLIRKLLHFGQDLMSSAERGCDPLPADGHGLEFGGDDFNLSCFTLHL